MTQAAVPPVSRQRPSNRPHHSAATALHLELAGLAAAAAAACAALTSQAAPTTHSGIDMVYVFALVGLVSLAGSRARRWTLALGAAVMLLVSSGLYSVVAAAAFLCAVVLLVMQRRDRVLGAAVAGAIGVCALNIGDIGPTYLSAAAAALAIIPILFSGFERASRRTRRWLTRVGGLVVLVGVIVCVVSAVVTYRSRSHVIAAVDGTLKGVRAARDGDDASANRTLSSAATEFTAAKAALDRPWARLSSFVPVLSQNMDALRAGVGEGTRVTRIGAATAGSLDYDALPLPGGGIDVDKLSKFEPLANRLAQTLSVSAAHIDGTKNPWLAPPIASRLTRMQSELEAYSNEADVAATATSAVPALLGRDFPRTYLIAFSNPAEARDMGGLLATWSLLRCDKGHMSIIETGGPVDMYGPLDPRPRFDRAYLSSATTQAMEPQHWPQNWTSTVDMGVMALEANDLVADTGRPEVDGVLYVDPEAFAGMLSLVGPTEIPGTKIVLTSANAAQFFLEDQFVKLPQTPEGDAALRQLVSDVFNKATSQRLPSPRRLGDVFGPLVRDGHLRFSSIRPQDQAIIRRLDLDGERQPGSAEDLFGVIVQNTAPNKIDPYVQRRATYQASYSTEDRRLRISGTLTFANQADPDNLPAVVIGNREGKPPGTAVMRLSVLSTFPSMNLSIGTQQITAIRTTESPGVYRYTWDAEIAPGSAISVDFVAQRKMASALHGVMLVGQASGDSQSLIEARMRVDGQQIGSVRNFGGRRGYLSAENLASDGKS